ncbi:MAG TPA: hypothetical protein VN642_18205, partial [Dongiaceae bacterium]|nr:hypothetical protein [Dongiaceae bacterium]
TNGARIDPTEALSIYNKKQFHHVYPRAYLKALGITKDDNLLVNICMLSASANLEISDKNPNEYLPASAIRLGTLADSVFASNLLPLPSQLDYSKATYEDFIKSRTTILMEYISRLCDGEIQGRHPH